MSCQFTVSLFSPIVFSLSVSGRWFTYRYADELRALQCLTCRVCWDKNQVTVRCVCIM